MIRSLKNTIVSTLNKQDVTVFKIRWPKRNRYSSALNTKIRINFSTDSTIFWGDGTSTSEPNIAEDAEWSAVYNYEHNYSEDFVAKNPIITIVCQGYPLINETLDYEEGIISPFNYEFFYSIEKLSSETKSARSLFSGCLQMTSIPENIFKGTLIKDYAHCFKGSGLTSIPETLFDYADSDANFESAFSGCHELTKSNLVFGGPNSKTFRNFKALFKYCTTLKTLNENTFKNVSSHSCMDEMFQLCFEVKIPTGFFDTQTTTSFDNVLGYCKLSLEDFVSDEPRISLDLFATTDTWTPDRRTNYPEIHLSKAFYSAIALDAVESIKAAAQKDPAKFTFKWGPKDILLTSLDDVFSKP